MATHKVPQDVESEDKLVGFLSLKQFIFVILGIASSWLAFVFATKVHLLSAIIFLPFMVVFFVLGLYQRKDQPVEIYLASALRFHLKPRTRKWDQEGYEERVIVTAPPKIEKHYTKNFTGEEASSRLSSLSHLMDTRGWATKVATDWQNPQLAVAAASDRLVQPGQLRAAGIDAQQYMQPTDVMDENSSVVAQDFQSRINQTDDAARQRAIQAVQNARNSTVGADDATNSVPPLPTYRQYPEMHQKVVAPEPPQVPTPPPAQATEPLTIPGPTQPQSAPTETTSDDGVEIKLH